MGPGYRNQVIKASPVTDSRSVLSSYELSALVLRNRVQIKQNYNADAFMKPALIRALVNFFAMIFNRLATKDAPLCQPKRRLNQLCLARTHVIMVTVLGFIYTYFLGILISLLPVFALIVIGQRKLL